MEKKWIDKSSLSKTKHLSDSLTRVEIRQVGSIIPVRIGWHNRAAANATPRQNAEPFWRSREREASMVHARLSHLPSPSHPVTYPRPALAKPEPRATNRDSAIESRTRTNLFNLQLFQFSSSSAHVLLTFCSKLFFIDVITSREQRF